MTLMKTMGQAELGVLLDLALAEFRPKAKKKKTVKVAAPVGASGTGPVSVLSPAALAKAQKQLAELKSTPAKPVSTL